MKIILRVIVILFVAAVVVGTATAIVNNTSIAASGPDREGGQPLAVTSAGQTAQRPNRPEGRGEEGGASIDGLLQVFVTLAKLTAITVIALLAEKGFSFLRKRAPHPAQS